MCRLPMLYFKCENFQKMGAFKMRGAANAIHNCNFVRYKKENRGVVTHSSGNFAQAVSLAAQKFRCQGVYRDARKCPTGQERCGVKTYAGEIIECESTPQAREVTAE